MSNYYVWPLSRGKNTPLAGEGPYGPFDMSTAKTYARIRSHEGRHDQAVTRGADPNRFEISAIYEAGTGYKTYPREAPGHATPNPATYRVEVLVDARADGWETVGSSSEPKEVIRTRKQWVRRGRTVRIVEEGSGQVIALAALEKRDREGRYTFSDMDRMCRCGHTLGQHLAARVRDAGKMRQDCLECDCEVFKPAREP